MCSYNHKIVPYFLFMTLLRMENVCTGYSLIPSFSLSLRGQQSKRCSIHSLTRSPHYHQYQFMNKRNLVQLHSRVIPENSETMLSIEDINNKIIQLCSSNQKGDAEEADRLFQLHLLKNNEDNNIQLPINDILQAYYMHIQQRKRSSSLPSSRILYYTHCADTFLSKVVQSDHTRANVNTQSFNYVLEMLSMSAAEKDLVSDSEANEIIPKVAGKEAAKRIAYLIKMMERFHNQDGNYHADNEEKLDSNFVKPDSLSYTLLMEAWSRTGDTSSIQRVRDMYRRLSQLHYESSPTTTTTSSMLEPMTRSFNAILLAWSKKQTTNRNESDKAAIQAEKQLFQMWSLYEELQSNGSQQEDYYIVRPDVTSYRYCMETWAESQTNDKACEKVQQLMLNLLEKQKLYPDLQPNVDIYNAMINAWSKNKSNPNAPLRAQQLFDILQKQEQKQKQKQIPMDDNVNNTLTPNTKTYNKLISAWSRSEEQGGNAMNAQQLLLDMEQEYELTRNENVRPNAVTYTTVISAWARSRSEEKAQRARSLLDRMLELSNDNKNGNNNNDDDDGDGKDIHWDANLAPDVACYNAVLNAASLSGFYGTYEYDNPDNNENVKKKAFATAVTTFNQLCNSDIIQPDHISFGTFLKCIANLLPSSDHKSDSSIPKQEIIRQVFQKCCRKGQVGDVVLKQLKKACSSERGLYESILMERLESSTTLYSKKKRGVMDMGVSDLPQEWTCNVREGRKFVAIRKTKGK